MFSKKALYTLFVCLFSLAFASSTVSDGTILITTVPVNAQSVCTPPLYQGYPSSCSNINIRWLNRDPISMIDHYEIYRGGIKITDAPGNAISFSEPVGCDFSSAYIIKQVMKSGATCQTATTGNPPHTRSCDMCPGGGGGGGGGGGSRTLNVVSAASFSAPVAPGSIAAIFANAGETLTSRTAPAIGFPLPTNISGTQVLVNGTSTGLFYISPSQINFLMPDTAIGTIYLTIIGSGGERTEGALLTAPNPAIFTMNSRGSGVAAALVTSDGRNFQSVANSSGAATPISVGSAGRPNYLVLFGTGLRTQGPVQAKIGGRDCTVVWSGPHSQLAGVDQVNVQLNDSLRGAGTVNVIVTVGGFIANFTQVNIGN